MKRLLRNIKDESGFTLLEVLMVCAIIGIIASVAVPKISSGFVVANTTKVLSDLRAIDTAVMLYQADKGSLPQKVADLDDYIADIRNVKPPKGSCRIKNGEDFEVVKIVATEYAISFDSDSGEARATLDGRTANEYGK
ncbi:MAG: prepilin-type N-terminal cleavage/methylation domain-containing protein [Selenomonadaceae bacterium]|nr:prepilin-type N-terminal cleavage/methylation domain-containing protein [Selenomonadaceae bacterium]MBR3723708.1 prepilin-type N-terminal cleavage/methylation domain-containing protein [Selenomonadaceae bacterium]